MISKSLKRIQPLLNEEYPNESKHPNPQNVLAEEPDSLRVTYTPRLTQLVRIPLAFEHLLCSTCVTNGMPCYPSGSQVFPNSLSREP